MIDVETLREILRPYLAVAELGIVMAKVQAAQGNHTGATDSYGLTRRQAECLAFLRSYAAKNGHAPSYNEIAASLGIVSKGCVSRMIHELAARGHVRVIKGHSRSVQVIQ